MGKSDKGLISLAARSIRLQCEKSGRVAIPDLQSQEVSQCWLG